MLSAGERLCVSLIHKYKILDLVEARLRYFGSFSVSK